MVAKKKHSKKRVAKHPKKRAVKRRPRKTASKRGLTFLRKEEKAIHKLLKATKKRSKKSSKAKKHSVVRRYTTKQGHVYETRRIHVASYNRRKPRKK